MGKQIEKKWGKCEDCGENWKEGIVIMGRNVELNRQWDRKTFVWCLSDGGKLSVCIRFVRREGHRNCEEELSWRQNNGEMTENMILVLWIIPNIIIVKGRNDLLWIIPNIIIVEGWNDLLWIIPNSYCADNSTEKSSGAARESRRSVIQRKSNTFQPRDELVDQESR
jgi:hypothetical protein